MSRLATVAKGGVGLMRVLHVVRDLDAASGGPSHSVPDLSRALTHQSIESVVLYEDFGQTIVEGIAENRCQSFVGVTRAGRFWNAKSFRESMQSECGDSPWDIVHLHGLWNGLNHYAADFARRERIPYVVSPRGMLSSWCFGQKKLKKKLGWMLYQKGDLVRADLLHATAEHETHDIRSQGLSNPIVCVPNGCVVDSDATFDGQRKKQIAFVSRIHPVKGLPLLVQAWAKVKPVGWKCIIAGPDTDGHLAAVVQIAKSLDVIDSIDFRPQVAGRQKWELLSRSSAVVLPSHSENFGVVIAEALAARTPVIATKGTPWQELETRKCGWWIDRDVESLASAIEKVVSADSDSLEAMGDRGMALVHEKYTWDRIASQFLESYQALHERRAPLDSWV